MLPLNRRSSKRSERPRMRAHRHCGGRSACPNSTTPAGRGISSTRSPRAHSRPGGFRVSGSDIRPRRTASSMVRLISASSRFSIDHPTTGSPSQLSSCAHEHSFASGTRAAPERTAPPLDDLGVPRRARSSSERAPFREMPSPSAQAFQLFRQPRIRGACFRLPASHFGVERRVLSAAELAKVHGATRIHPAIPAKGPTFAEGASRQHRCQRASRRDPPRPAWCRHCLDYSVSLGEPAPAYPVTTMVVGIPTACPNAIIL